MRLLIRSLGSPVPQEVVAGEAESVAGLLAQLDASKRAEDAAEDDAERCRLVSRRRRCTTAAAAAAATARCRLAIAWPIASPG